MITPLPDDIDAYIAGCDPKIQPLLCKLRSTITETAPEAGEKISWGMATFTYYGNLVHFSAEKRHIGFHPGPSAIEAFEDRLTEFHYSKGTIQLPYDQPLPLELIRSIVTFRVEEQARLAEEKKLGKKQETAVRPRYPMPEDIDAALLQEGLYPQYEARPPYQRNDYIGWINRAKRLETREKRLNQMLTELRDENTYMGMSYSPKK